MTDGYEILLIPFPCFYWPHLISKVVNIYWTLIWTIHVVKSKNRKEPRPMKLKNFESTRIERCADQAVPGSLIWSICCSVNILFQFWDVYKLCCTFTFPAGDGIGKTHKSKIIIFWHRFWSIVMLKCMNNASIHKIMLKSCETATLNMAPVKGSKWAVKSEMGDKDRNGRLSVLPIQ